MVHKQHRLCEPKSPTHKQQEHRALHEAAVYILSRYYAAGGASRQGPPGPSRTGRMRIRSCNETRNRLGPPGPWYRAGSGRQLPPALWSLYHTYHITDDQAGDHQVPGLVAKSATKAKSRHAKKEPRLGEHQLPETQAALCPVGTKAECASGARRLEVRKKRNKTKRQKRKQNKRSHQQTPKTKSSPFQISQKQNFQTQ